MAIELLPPYPTRNGLPLSVEEIGLAPSVLPIDQQIFSNHHYLFDGYHYISDFILNSLRNLETMQILLAEDRHRLGETALHTIYGPPPIPSHAVAMNRLDEAFQSGERFKIRIPSQGYTYFSFSPEHWQTLEEAYTVSKSYTQEELLIQRRQTLISRNVLSKLGELR